jgi:GNAT superfamily N-acetyltransferase/endogenous inhibitor of DNA gyrase (YacG/DUF329 family)
MWLGAQLQALLWSAVIIGRPFLPDGRRLIISTADVAEYDRFSAHHYLHTHGVATINYLATLGREPVGWLSLVHSYGHEGRRVHRLVVLPAFRRLGIATVLVSWFAARSFEPLSIRTRNAAFVAHLLTLPGWRRSLHSGGDRTTPDRRTGHGDTVAATAVYDPGSVTATVTCVTCGCRFETRRRHAQYCGDRCRAAACRERKEAMALPPISCQNCGKPVVGKRSHARYCSGRCRQAALRARR